MRLRTFVLLITASRILLVVVLILDIFLLGYNVGYGVAKNATPSGAPHQMFPASGTVLRGAPLSVATSAERVALTAGGPALAVGSGAPIYSGTATWFCGTVSTCTHGYRPGDLIAAIDRKDSPFRQGDRVTVRAFGRTVTVTIVDSCACGGTRLIDLSKAAFARLANPDLGVIPVTLELADAPLPTGPATDVGS